MKGSPERIHSNQNSKTEKGRVFHNFFPCFIYTYFNPESMKITYISKSV